LEILEYKNTEREREESETERERLPNPKSKLKLPKETKAKSFVEIKLTTFQSISIESQDYNMSKGRLNSTLPSPKVPIYSKVDLALLVSCS